MLRTVILCGKDTEYLSKLLPYVGAPHHSRLMSMHPLSEIRTSASMICNSWAPDYCTTCLIARIRVVATACCVPTKLRPVQHATMSRHGFPVAVRPDRPCLLLHHVLCRVQFPSGRNGCQMEGVSMKEAAGNE